MSRVRTSLVWSFAQRYTALIVTLAGTMIIARLLTPEQIGVYSLCAAFVSLGSALRDFGVSEYLIQARGLTRDKLRGAFAVAIAVAWLVAGVLFGIRNFVAAYYHEPGVSDVIEVLCLHIALLPFASPAFALLNRDMAFRSIFVIQTVSLAVHAVTGVSLAFAGHGYMSLAWANVTSTLVQVLLVTYFRPKDTLILPSFRHAKGIWSYGAMTSASGLIQSVGSNMHEFVIGRQFGFNSLGLFSRAFGLVGQFYENITAAIQRVATPAFAEDHRAGHSLHYTYGRAVTIFTSIAWPFFTFMAIMATDVIDVLLGSQWHAAAPIAIVFCAGSILSSLWALAPQLLAATGQVKRRLLITIISSPLNVIGVIVASFFGLLAVAFAMTVNWTVQLALYTYHLGKVLNFTAADLLRAVAKSMKVAIVVALGQAIAAIAAAKLGLPSLVALAVVGSVSAAVWLACVAAFRHPIHDELVRAWRMFRAARAG